MSEIIADGGRRRHWGTPEKVRSLCAAMAWRRPCCIAGGDWCWKAGSVAVAGDDDVNSNRQVREMDNRIRELERSRPEKATLLLPEPVR